MVPVTEDELYEEIRGLCARLGLWSYHPHNPLRDEKGWPDLVIIGKRALFRELKSGSGQLRRDQRRIGYLIQAAGLDWAVWHPADLASGRIERELKGIT